MKSISITTLFLFFIFSEISYGESGVGYNLESKEGQFKILKQIEKNIKSLDSLFLNLTPEEQNWLNEEGRNFANANENDQPAILANIMNSELFLRDSFKQQVKKILRCTKFIKEQYGLNKNIRCWAILAHTLSHKTLFNRYHRLLILHNLFEHKPSYLHKTTYIHGDVIFNQIILPYIEAQVNENSLK